MKPGVKPDHHAIIYSENRYSKNRYFKNRPPNKLDGEEDLVNAPIRVEPTSPRHHLELTSRLNYAKLYTVEHNIKACFIGRLHADSYRTFKGDCLRINNTILHDNADDTRSRNDASLTEDSIAATEGSIATTEDSIATTDDEAAPSGVQYAA